MKPNDETSDTYDNVKTKINTKHMKLYIWRDEQVNVHVVFLLVLFGLRSSYSLIAHTSRGSRCPRVCLISSVHEVSVHSSTLSSPFHPTSSSHSSSISRSSCCPSTSTRLSSKITCATSPRRWGQLTSPFPTHKNEFLRSICGTLCCRCVGASG